MKWNAESQRRFDELRRAELNEALTEDEQAELAALVDILGQDEVRALAPAVAQIQVEQRLLESQIEAAAKENAELAKLLNQQQQLVADARRWLVQAAYLRVGDGVGSATGTDFTSCYGQ